MKGFAKTDVGKAREMNQDYYSIPSSESDLQLYILADGMGGYNGGEIASRLAAETTKNYIQNNFKKIEHDKEAILKLVKDAMEYANMVVYEESKKDENLQGMGTTLDVCFIYNSKIYIGHVGDSRIYLIKKDIARKITKDHSYVQQLVEDKKITREEAEHHPKKNMLLKALGCTSYVEPDIRARNLEKDDILLMCSDGLTNMVEESKIYEVVRENKEKAPEILVNLANNAGGYDNITVITII
ncbi:protein serine/threonine phosphatase PrpC regulation of stationary phase [Clostridium sp. CAG:508]|jgi:serine/threonine protein phosphatase PrpC|nr:Stp1/IreP family PP2C-type Ser/Thr phosphatase [Clostridia bacterium]CDC31711.1 protein serine/threonine phosphatase PrpC regulation of stationary phase [Clostridium sp. CAG:508]